jgi:hypothetical protein
VYYEARDLALKSGGLFHLAAFTRGERTKIGVNRHGRNTAKYRRRYKNSPDTFHEVHAEVDLILKLREIPDKICVVRFFKDGTPTMAKPCIHCQNFLRIKGVKTVRYTNWNGEWEEMRL